MSRRKAGSLLPLEEAILSLGVESRARDEFEFYGFAVAKAIRDQDASRRLTSHGTLYKALDRLERAGLLESRWEDAEIAASEGRPRRRLYRVTGAGELALGRAQLERSAAVDLGAAPA